MSNHFKPGGKSDQLFQRAREASYGFEPHLLGTRTSNRISEELDDYNMLQPLIEMVPAGYLYEYEFPVTRLVHEHINTSLNRVSGVPGTILTHFSVRVFEPGEPATTIHRNDPSIGPWAVGITLRGSAPFSVYKHDDLPEDCVIPLKDNPNPPTPMDTMDVNQGSAWTLFTKYDQRPHSGGLVSLEEQRELIIFYSFQ